ncbi:GxxExxY protein [Desulfosarcina ovata]|nr:GxxExxY protein [Desulfosarcina ovata]
MPLSVFIRVHPCPINMKHQALTEEIIKVFYRVYNALGYGFLEKVYENAMMIEFKKEGLSALQQSPIDVIYSDQIVGQYFADLIVDGKVIVEIKAKKHLGTEDEAQLLNYLKATDKEVGLLINFGPKPELTRKVFSNSKK